MHNLKDTPFWREKALEIFPELNEEINNPKNDLVCFLYDLQGGLKENNNITDKNCLRRMFEFANWCLGHQDEYTHEMAGVSFFEHIFNDIEDWQLIAPYLSWEKIESIRPLMEWAYSKEMLVQLKKIIDENPKRE